ncbi:hypothetical protein QO179_24345 [Bacillus stercoris]|nr:hypothetical protein [Bacillus stercoris]
MEEKSLLNEKEFEGLSGIFIAEYQMSNMKLERIVVSNPAIVAILEVTKLQKEAQEEAVFNLVDRTENWLELEEEVRIDKIKAVLTQETVIEYLRSKDVIRAQCDLVQVGIDQEGSIVVEAYYTEMNREQRRAMKNAMSKKQRENLASAVNILSGNDNLVDLAAKKLEKLKKKGKVKNVAKPKNNLSG